MSRKPKREYIIRTAAGLFADRGYSVVEVNDVLAAAGINKGQFYYYFDGKEDMMMQIVELCILDTITMLNEFPRTIEGVKGFFRSQCGTGAPAGIGAFCRLSVDISLLNGHMAESMGYAAGYLEDFIKEALIKSAGCSEKRAADYTLFTISAFHGCMLRGRVDSVNDMMAIFEDMVFGNIDRMLPQEEKIHENGRII